MVAEVIETHDPRDRYDPEIVRRMLELYPYLLDHLGHHDDPRPGKAGKVRSFTDPQIARSHRKADLDRALQRLFEIGQDPVAAQAICDYYGVNPWRGEPVQRMGIDEVAADLGRSERTAYRVIERGIRRIARLLGWQAPKGGCEEDDDSG